MGIVDGPIGTGCTIGRGRSLCDKCRTTEKRNRKKRGIYIVDTMIYNADAVGAYNILRKYHAVFGKEIDMPVTGLSSTKTIKVAV